MSGDLEGASADSVDEALDGDLELEPEDADRVTGGMMVMCNACGHHHSQTDPRCNSRCLHGTSTGSRPGPTSY
jgi:hypothetical protein